MPKYEFTPVQRLITVEAVVTAFDTVHPKGFYFAGEMHDFWEAVLVCQGSATATGDERVYQLSAGQLLFHKPMEFHRIWAPEDSEHRVIIISFRALGPGMDHFAETYFQLDEERQRAFGRIADAIQETVRACREKREEYPLLSSTAAVLLESFLLSLTEKTACAPEMLSKEERYYRRIVNCMSEHCCENLSVGELAFLCGMSVSNLKRVFALFSDRGVAKYFLSMKMRRAMELLEEGRRPCQVARLLGFEEPAYFHAVFKRETGMTPGEYRKGRRAG